MSFRYSLSVASLCLAGSPLLSAEPVNKQPAEPIKSLTLITNPLGSAFGGVNLVLDAALHENWSAYIGSAYQDAKIFDTRLIGTGVKVGAIYYLNSYHESTPYLRAYYGYGDFSAYTKGQENQRVVSHFLSVLGGYEHVLFDNRFIVGYGAGIGYDPNPKPIRIYEDGKKKKVMLNAEGSHWSPNIELNIGYRFF